MSFMETPRFPDEVSVWADGGAGYNTTVVILNSGYEQRNVNWAQSRGRWDVSNGLRQTAQVQATIAFFRAVKGKAHGFRFRDFNDYRDNGNGAFTSVTVSPIVFQLVKNYTPSGASLTEARPIQKPVASAFVMKRLGVTLVPGVGVNEYALDSATGKVTLGVGSDTTVGNFTWTGEFDVPVRFDTDEMRGHLEPQGGFYEWNPIPVIEIRV